MIGLNHSSSIMIPLKKLFESASSNVCRYLPVSCHTSRAVGLSTNKKTMTVSFNLLFILLLMVMLVAVHCSSNSTTTKSFKPYFNKKKWRVACQRIYVNATTNKFFDFEYYYDSSVGVGIQTDISISFKVEKNTMDFWFAKSVSSNSTTKDGIQYNALVYEPIQPTAYYSGWIEYTYSIYHWKLDHINLIGSLSSIYNNSLTLQENIEFNELIYLNNSDLYNRSQCFDLNNIKFYHADKYMRTREYIDRREIIHLCGTIPVFVLVIVFSRGILSRRRALFAILSNTMLCITIMIHIVYTLFRYLYFASNLTYDRKCNIIQRLLETCINLFYFASIALYCFQIFRYFQIRYMYKLLFRNKKQHQSVLLKSIFSKRVYSAVFVLVTIILQTMVYLVAMILVNTRMIVKYRRGKTSLLIATPNRHLMVLVEAFILLIPFLVDFILNLVKIKRKGIINYFISDDPLLYRFETLFIVILLPLFIPYAIYSRTDLPIFKTSAGSLSYLVFITIIFQLIVGNGLISLIEIYRLILKFFRKKNSTNSKQEQEDLIVSHLKNDQFFQLFSRYCLKELSYENIEIWKILQVAKENDCIQIEEFKQLYETFISNSSPIQVNIASKTKKTCDQLLASELSEISFMDWRSLYSDVIANLSDTYSRFTDTPQYTNYIGVKRTLQKEFHIVDNVTTNYELMTK
jgi:hypothetical protein